VAFTYPSVNALIPSVDAGLMHFLESRKTIVELSYFPAIFCKRQSHQSTFSPLKMNRHSRLSAGKLEEK